MKKLARIVLAIMLSFPLMFGGIFSILTSESAPVSQVVPQGGGGNPLTSDDDDSYPPNGDENPVENDSEEITYTYKTYYDYFIDNMDCTGVYDDNGNLTNVTISDEKKAEILSSDFTGSGTSTDPYQVNSSLGFWFMSKFVTLTNKYVELNCDVILNDETFDENGNASGGDGVVYQWKPINFYGNITEIDGNNHKILNLYYNDATNDAYYVGLFGGSVTIITLQNLRMEGTYILTKGTAFSIADTVDKAANCVTTGNLISTGNVCGFAASCKKIYDCQNYVNIETDGYLGAGFCIWSLVEAENCQNFGNITAGAHAGGICSAVSSYGVEIENCDNYGEICITDSYWAGGIVSYIYNKNENIIRNCNNYGTIKTLNCSAMGGIVGEVAGSACLIENCDNYGNIDAFEGSGFVGQILGSAKAVEYISEILIVNCRALAKNCDVPFLCFNSSSTKEVNVSVKNCIMEIENENFVSEIIRTVYMEKGGSLTIENFHVKLLSNPKDNIFYFTTRRGKTSAGAYHLDMNIKNVLVECLNSANVSNVSNMALKANINSMVIKNSDGSGYYYGSNFSSFYISWRTGKIGLKALDGVGYFQGAIDEAWLANNGFVKKD